MGKYTLNKIERRYSEKTLITYYYQPVNKAVKRYKPIDIDGYRYKLDTETGEYDYYTRKDCELSKSASVKRSRIRLNEILDMNVFDWFVTLTFDPDRIDRTNEIVVQKAYCKFIDNLTYKYPDIVYVSVPENHDDGAIHFHIVFGNILGSQLGLVNSGKVLCSWVTRASSKGKCSLDYFDKTKGQHELSETDGQVVYNCSEFIYGFSDVTRIVNRAKCSTYVKKYIDKDFGSTDIFKKRFYYSKNCERPIIVKKIIGDDISHLSPINKVDLIKDEIAVIVADESKVDSEHNIMQVWVNNNKIDELTIGPVTPLSKENNLAKKIELLYGEK